MTAKIEPRPYLSRKIRASLDRVWCLWRTADEIKRDITSSCFVYRCYYRFILSFFLQKFAREKQELFKLLEDESHNDFHLIFFLEIGEVLYSVGEFEEAIKCFDKVIKGIGYYNFDASVQAIMGKIESEIALREWDIFVSSQVLSEIAHLCDTVNQDLRVVSREVRSLTGKRLEHILSRIETSYRLSV